MMLSTGRGMTKVRINAMDRTRKESLELMFDGEFMRSYKRAKEQIKKREFVDWNAL